MKKIAKTKPLKITDIKLKKHQMLLTKPFETSFGRFDKLTKIIPQISFVDSENNKITGIGECPALPAPWYDGETHYTVEQILKKAIIPSLKKIKHPVCNVEEFIASYKWVVNHNMAKVGVEGAYWDALGKSLKKPVWQLWGGKRKKVPSGTSIGLEPTPQGMMRKIIYAVEKMKVIRVKIKIKPGSDLKYIHSIRKQYPNLPLIADANAAYDFSNSNHLRSLQSLDMYNLMMIEQPGPNDDILEHADFSTKLKTPICLDESISNLRHAQQAIKLWQERKNLKRLIINIKPPRVGGFWEAVKIAKLCGKHKVSTWCGGMLESAIGKTANAHFSSLAEVNLPGDHVSQGPYYKKDLTKPPPYKNGHIFLSDKPGWGISYEKLI